MWPLSIWQIAILSVSAALLILVLVLAIDQLIHWLKKPKWIRRHLVPGRWEPKEHLGPARMDDPFRTTPGGIPVSTHGFDREDIPLIKAGRHGDEMRARVVLSDIDDIWDFTRKHLVLDNALPLSPEERRIIEDLPDDYPVVDIAPTIWWGGNDVGWLSSLVDSNKNVMVTVWYESESDGEGRDGYAFTNWSRLLHKEFSRVCFLACGRWDLVL